MRRLNTKTLLMALALLSPATALADGVFHPTGQSYACVNPRATRALANHADPRQNDPGWVHFVITDGRCFQVDPGEKWEQISQENGLLLLRRDPPRTGMPPLFFLPQQVSAGLPIPPQPSAETPTDGPVQLAPASPDLETTPQSSGETTDILPKGWQKPRHDTAPPKDATTEEDSAPNEPASPVSPPAVSKSAPDTNSGYGGILFLLLIFCGVAGYYGFRFWQRADDRRRRMEREQQAWEIAQREIYAQASTLQIKRFQKLIRDDYGTLDVSRWMKEIDYFCSSRLLPLLSLGNMVDQWPLIQDRARQLIDDVAQGTPPGAVLNQKPLSDPRVFDPQMDPIDYERHCALLLEQAGWNARVTQASGDQGADVIATKGGRKIVVQCKLYSQPVGNKAVQEVYAAKQHQQADEAIVVSNAGYTIPARQIAATTGVHLLHHQELASFCERLAA